MPSPRQAFTLLELVVVIAIIIALAGISLAVVGVVRSSQRKTATLALVNAVALAVEAYQTDTLVPPAGGAQRPLWDVDLDFVIDPRPATVPALAALSPPWYGGYAAMVGSQLPGWARDADGHVIDRWNMPLRLDWPGWRTDAQKDAAGVGAARGGGTRPYGAAKVGVWSLGPDRTDAAPGGAAEADNLRSW